MIDIILFSIFVWFFKGQQFSDIAYIPISTVFARILSAFWNYSINRRIVFRSRSGSKLKSGIKYMTLAITIMTLSAVLVTVIHFITRGNESIIKIVVDSILCILSFIFQREFVFDEK